MSETPISWSFMPAGFTHIRVRLRFLVRPQLLTCLCGLTHSRLEPDARLQPGVAPARAVPRGRLPLPDGGRLGHRPVALVAAICCPGGGGGRLGSRPGRGVVLRRRAGAGGALRRPAGTGAAPPGHAGEPADRRTPQRLVGCRLRAVPADKPTAARGWRRTRRCTCRGGVTAFQGSRLPGRRGR